MTSRPSALRLVLSVAACSVVLAGCGNGLTFGIAPGGPPPVEEPEPELDAGPVERPDAGPETQPDTGPVPDNCTTVTTELTPEEDLAAFSAAGIPAAFTSACNVCHLNRSPGGEKMTWGSSAGDTDEGWFEASSTLLTLPRNAGLPVEQTTLYQAFAGVFDEQASQHSDNPTAKAAVTAWFNQREEGITETICTDAGPGPDPGTDAGPGPDPGCTPTLPSEAESEARFIELNLGTTFALCNACHVGSTKESTATLQAWGAKENTPEGWHVAFWGKAKQENYASDVTQSVLYTHFDGYDSTHGVRATERDSTEEWLEYALNGEVPAGCP